MKNLDDYLEFHKRVCDEMRAISKQKNTDYAGTQSHKGPFFNFTLIEHMGGATTEQGFLTRMSDKFSRLVNIVASGNVAVKDESITDTLLDLSNYCILFAGYLESKKHQTTTSPGPKLKVSGVCERRGITYEVEDQDEKHKL